MKKIIFLLLISILSISCASLQIKEDKLKGTKDIKYNSNNLYDELLLSLTIRETEDKQLFLLYISTGYINNWISLQSAEIYDSHTYDKNKRISFNLDNIKNNIGASQYGAFVNENSTIIVSIKEIEKLYEILKNSKKVSIRYSGKNSYEEKTLGNSTKEAIIKTIEYYYKNIAK